MQIEMYSDIVCPWCSIGKTRFEKALAELTPAQRDRISTVVRPYQLDPTAPDTPQPVMIGYAKKFGGPERAEEIINHVTTTAAADGITFHMDIAQRANTFSAHRLLWMALHDYSAATQNALKTRLMKAYFHDGLNVANHEVLALCAEDVGITNAAEFLASNRGVGETQEELAMAQELGITAVPTFVINGQWSIPGAQDPDTFVRVLTKLLAEESRAESAEPAITVDGDSCAVDTPNC
jgi:predicted DsbA family dithiol-disulfide isomerase